MEGTILVNKAGTFNSNDTWNLIPLHQEIFKGKILTLRLETECIKMGGYKVIIEKSCGEVSLVEQDTIKIFS